MSCSNWRYCELGHLMVASEALGRRYFSHINDDDALQCAYLVSLGWPDPRLTTR